MSSKTWRPYARAAAALALAAAAAAVPAPGLAQFAVSQVPTLISAPPPTNIIMTIDDSGSMGNAFVPDSVGQEFGNTLAFTSSDYNRLYYNPNINYQIPLNAAHGINLRQRNPLCLRKRGVKSSPVASAMKKSKINSPLAKFDRSMTSSR